MRRLLTRIIFTLCCLLTACNTGGSGPSVQTSGNTDFDQTASFTLHTIRDLKKRRSLNTPSSIISYITSTQGSAELMPPDPELEGDAAAGYRGPRPARGIWIQGDTKRNEFFERHLVLVADDARGVIIAEAFDIEDDEPFYRWEWEMR